MPRDDGRPEQPPRTGAGGSDVADPGWGDGGSSSAPGGHDRLGERPGVAHDGHGGSDDVDGEFVGHRESEHDDEDAGRRRDDDLIGAGPGPDDPHRRRRATRGGLVVAFAVLVLVAGIALAAVGLRPLIAPLFADKDYDGPGSGVVTVLVQEGDTGSDIASTLERDGIVKTTDAFVEALSTSKGAEIQPGQYSLKQQMKASDALAALRGARNVTRVTIREGLWKNEVFAALSKATGTPLADYTAAEKAARTSPGLLGLPASAKGNLEGYLFPATYEFDPKTSARDQLRRLVAQATKQLRELGVPEAQMERIVILASIVEAEARADADRPKVARVLLNRLEQNMPLQLDSTVSYGVQRKAITTTDAERAAKNGYNTYVRRGLPVGPINNPGAASIRAAQNPAEGPWLFFVTVNPTTGETVFSVDGAGHQKAVLQFQKWCQANPGQC